MAGWVATRIGGEFEKLPKLDSCEKGWWEKKSNEKHGKGKGKEEEKEQRDIPLLDDRDHVLKD